MSEQGGSPPAGWYPDGEGFERRWDGTSWTEDRRPVSMGEQTQVRPSTPPPGAAPTQFPGPSGAPPADATQMAGPGGPSGPPPGSAPGYGALGGSPYAPGGGAPQQGYPGGDPQFGGPPPPGGPGGPGGFGFDGPGGPQQPKKSKLPIIIAAAVALVVLIGVGVTFAIVGLGGDDDKKADDGKGEKKDDGGDDEGGSTDFAARSDFNGDGFGDAAGRFYDGNDFKYVTLTSDGESTFEVEDHTSDSAAVLWEDWDGDGTGTPVTFRWSSYDEELRLEPEDDSMSDDEFNFSLWDELEYYLRVDSGDFNGDDIPDLMVMGQSDAYKVTFWVLAGSGDGFEDPEEWLTLDKSTYGSTTPFPGDWDGDGTDDILAFRGTDEIKPGDRDSGYYSGKLGAALLTSDGEGAFEAGETGDLPFERWSSYAPYAVGPFGPDGETMLAVQGADYTTQDVKFYSYADGNVEESDDLEVDYEGFSRGMTASDVNGDGEADLIMAQPDAEDSSEADNMLLKVLLRDGDSFAEAADWGSLECDDSCSLQFDVNNAN